MKSSILQNQRAKSPLKAMAVLQSVGGEKKEKSLFFSLNLTTLIDAFCILVIFLLSNMNGQIQNLNLSKDMVLPSALQSETLSQEGLVIRIEKNEFVINEQRVSKGNIAEAIFKAKTADKMALIIQADRQSEYENIGLILRAGGQAGYEKYVFAVLPGT